MIARSLSGDGRQGYPEAAVATVERVNQGQSSTRFGRTHTGVLGAYIGSHRFWEAIIGPRFQTLVR